jgi:hypothetical protein
VNDFNLIKTAARTHTWLGHQVTKYHHTLEEYLNLVMDAGFKQMQVRESCPQTDNFLNEEEYERRLRIPLFLLIQL